jgi:uncharacterized protein with beta-barrel porin domain
VHDGESGSLDTPRLMLYGNYALGPWSLDATAGYAHDFIDAARPIASVGETASSSHGADEATGAVQAARRFDLGGVTLLPAAGLQYVHLFDGGFSESGAPGFDLDVSRRNSDSLRPFVRHERGQSLHHRGRPAPRARGQHQPRHRVAELARIEPAKEIRQNVAVKHPEAEGGSDQSEYFGKAPA